MDYNIEVSAKRSKEIIDLQSKFSSKISIDISTNHALICQKISFYLSQLTMAIELKNADMRIPKSYHRDRIKCMNDLKKILNRAPTSEDILYHLNQHISAPSYLEKVVQGDLNFLKKYKKLV